MGGGGGGKSGGGSGGASDFDMALINKATQENIQALENRYKQLGLGQASGDPLTAALHGQSLTYAGPSTMEAQDVANQQQLGQAAIGQVQAENITNKFAPGSPANLAFQQSQLTQLASAAGQTAGQFGGNAGTGSTSNAGGDVNPSSGSTSPGTGGVGDFPAPGNIQTAGLGGRLGLGRIG